MIDLTGLPMLDIAIGLAFLYFLLSIVCSSISDIIASVLKMRARNLETGIRVLVGSKGAAAKFFDDWRVAILQTPKWRDSTKQGKSRKPSYIPPETAALALVDTFVPDAAAEARKIAADSKPSKDEVEKVKALVAEIEDEKTKVWLTRLVVDVRGDLDKVRAALEDRFNEVMDRASGWYKRKSQIVVFVVALSIAGGLNADTINVADRLSRDEALRAHVVAQARKAGNADTKTNPTTKDIEDEINAARASGLPLGWGGENVPNHPLALIVLEKTAGIVITAFALLLGAPFWFDVLGKFARLRSTGNRIGTPKDDSLAPTDRDDRMTRSVGGAAAAR